MALPALSNRTWQGEDQGTFATEARRLSRGGVVGLLGQGTNVVLAFVFSLIVSRLFRAPGAGVYFETLAIMTIAGNVGDLGADDGLNWMVPRLRAFGRVGEVRALLPLVLIPVLLWSAALAAVLELLAPSIAHVFAHHRDTTQLVLFIRISAPLVPAMALVQVLIAGTRAFGRVWPLAGVWSLVVPIIRLLVLPVLLAAGLGLAAVAWSWAVPVAVGCGALLWALLHFVRRETGASPQAPVALDSKVAKQFWVFSAPRAAASVCSMLLLWLDVLFVGWLLSLRWAAVYAVASRYMAMITVVLAAVGSTIAPQASRLLATDRRQELNRLYQTATAWVTMVTWPACLLMCVFSPLLMRIFGKQFAAGDTALTILAFMMLYQSATGNNTALLVMSGNGAASLMIGLGTLGLNAGLNLLLIPWIGIDGAAFAWAASLFLSNVLTNAYLYRRLGLHPFGAAFWPVVGASLGAIALPAVAARLALGPHLGAFALTVCVGLPCYFLVLRRYRHHLEFDQLVAGLVAARG